MIFQNLQTKNCVACGKPAIWFSGHVHLYGCHEIHVTAGWCDVCTDVTNIKKTPYCRNFRTGCLGWYADFMDVQIITEY